MSGALSQGCDVGALVCQCHGRYRDAATQPSTTSIDTWGIDHGTWSVLVHAFPDADIPVVQLAINESEPLDYHRELGAKLAPLRDTGVLIIGSGNIVHNRGGMHRRLVHNGFDWAQRFNEAAAEVVLVRPAEAARLAHHRDVAKAAPTPEHFIPMLYLAGLASVGAAPGLMVDGYSDSSVSMTSYTLDAAPQVADSQADADPAPLPDIDPEHEPLNANHFLPHRPLCYSGLRIARVELRARSAPPLRSADRITRVAPFSTRESSLELRRRPGAGDGEA